MEKEFKKHDALIPGIGNPAPEFQALTAQGVVNFPSDYKGKWTILFSQPAHYSPDCSLVGVSIEQIEEHFNKVNCRLIELEFEGLYSQVVWLRTIKEKMVYERMKDVKMTVPYKKIAMEVAEKYGLINFDKDSSELASTVFFINSKGIIRAIIYYPLKLEKKFDELYKVVLALQNAEKTEINAVRNSRSKGNRNIEPSISQGRKSSKREYTKQDCKYWFC